MTETGFDAGIRNVGRFFLALIPWAIGVGLLSWLAVWVAFHEFRHELSQEQRAASYVGAEQRPKERLTIEIIPHGCVHIERVDVDGARLLMIARNGCHRTIDYVKWNWQLVAPDGTALHAGYENTVSCAAPTLPDSKAECVARIVDDDRAKGLRVWTSE